MGRVVIVVACIVCAAAAAPLQAQQGSGLPRPSTAAAVTEFARSIAPVLNTYCSSCHADGAREGGLALDELDAQIAGGRDFEMWRMIHERVKFGEMPPPESEQPTDRQRRGLLASIRAALLKTQCPGRAATMSFDLPRYGNYVDHAALFHDEAGPVQPGPPRVWRLRPEIYREVLIGDTRDAGPHQLADPLNVAGGREFQDYASLYFIDEPSTGQLLANAETIVRFRSRSALDMLTAGDEPPRDETVAAAIRTTCREILRREPTTEELGRYQEFYRSLLHTTGRRLAAERMLMAVYMHPEALFREELGAGTPDKQGRIRLAQREIALAVSYALGNRPDELLCEAARQGELATRQQVAAHVQRRFHSPAQRAGNPRMLQFFREYFDYPYASEVFKNPPLRGAHLPHMLTTDLDLLIEHVVQQDREVLFQLLTTNRYFVDCRRDPQSGRLCQSSLDLPNRDSLGKSRNPEHATVYGLPRDWIWTDRQPVVVPGHMRAGVLTHPAWLVAWSGNFDNHPVQRGKWIRTHLLGGTVPDLPIGVNATVPEDRQKQFRERITMATAAAECQRCHRKMDPLGLPFEQYTHYGRFRIRELDRPVNTSGTIAYVDDERLVGPVSHPVEMMHRLAKSAHVEQVFVRYAFRYFMGRNETLGDAQTLRDAHRAYRQQGGSFRALVVALLTSDSFLYRTPEAPDA